METLNIRSKLSSSLGRRARAITRIIDVCVLSFAFWLSFFLRFDGEIPPRYIEQALFVWPYVVIAQCLALVVFRTMSYAWKYVGLREAVRIFAALTVASSVFLAFRLFLADWLLVEAYASYRRVPIGVIVMDLTLAFLGVLGVRVLRRLTFERGRARQRETAKPKIATLLVGAGEAGLAVAKDVEQHPNLGLRLVGFVDDDATKVGNVVHGLTVLGTTTELEKIARKKGAKQAIITIATLSGEDVRRIQRLCGDAGLEVKIIPSLSEILDGRVSVGGVRDVSIEDLLRRPVADLETDRLTRFLEGRRVLVTGAGGSIGSEISRQVARLAPEVLVLLERSEPQLFRIHSELLKSGRDDHLVPCLTDLCDEEGVEAILATFKPHVVFHAAAHKHVPMLEWNAAEAVRNNVVGTQHVVDGANRHGVETFVMLSTDKAVNPTSIMGATKRTAEMILQGKSQQSSTKFVSVRFGNVLGSTGSVVPIFQQQIAAGGPVTITHPEMRRYFMTISEATQLVLVAGSMGRGGEIFVLDMGEPVKILDLAFDLIKLSGFEPEVDIPIEFTGIRPGEKLFEELGFDRRSMEKTVHPAIFVLKQEAVAWTLLARRVEQLGAFARERSPTHRLRNLLESIVPEMQAAPHVESAHRVEHPSLISSSG